VDRQYKRSKFHELTLPGIAEKKLSGKCYETGKLKQNDLKEFIKAVRSRRRNSYEAIHDLNDDTKSKRDF